MRNEFIVKMVKAEILRYEAIKEILPECVQTKIDDMESNFKDIMKQLAFEMIKDSASTNASVKKEEQNKDTRKISVDFDN